MEILKPYILCFIPLFVAVNAIGISPYYLTLTEGMKPRERHKVARMSIITATAIALVFIFIGKFVFWIMGISVADFKIAGGILLLIISIHLLLPGERKRVFLKKDVGVFPLGTPLITGPAVLTTSLVLIDSYGIIPTLLGFLLNVVVTMLIFMQVDRFVKFFGVGGMRAFSKAADILLSAFAVTMIRRGILEILGSL
ncbi:MAG: MarC family protein [Candidatus Omnitrophota bacterium]